MVLAALATWSILPDFLSIGTPQGTGAYTSILDSALLVFVIAELFKIALAYIRHEGVIPAVMEAALVAVTRKVVVLDAHATPSLFLMRAGALGLLLVALSVSWYLLSRTNPEFSKVPPHAE